MREDDRAGPAEKGLEIPRGVEPVGKALRNPRNAPAERASRVIAETPKDGLDVGAEEVDPPVREERGDESGDLLIRRLTIRQEGAERIARDRGARQHLAPQILEDAPHRLRT